MTTRSGTRVVGLSVVDGRFLWSVPSPTRSSQGGAAVTSPWSSDRRRRRASIPRTARCGGRSTATTGRPSAPSSGWTDGTASTHSATPSPGTTPRPVNGWRGCAAGVRHPHLDGPGRRSLLRRPRTREPRPIDAGFAGGALVGGRRLRLFDIAAADHAVVARRRRAHRVPVVEWLGPAWATWWLRPRGSRCPSASSPGSGAGTPSPSRSGPYLGRRSCRSLTIGVVLRRPRAVQGVEQRVAERPRGSAAAAALPIPSSSRSGTRCSG